MSAIGLKTTWRSDDLSALLVAIGFEQEVVDSFVARIKDREFVHHRGLRNVAFDLIDSGIHRWATDYYTPSGEPEDGVTKPKGSTGCGRDQGDGGQSGGQGGGRSGGQGGGRSGGQGGGRSGDKDGGSGGSSGGGDDSDNEEGGRTRTSAGQEEEKVITLYHGTTFGFAESIFYDGANLSEGRRNTDFSIDRAFYLGNNASLAQRWADQKASQSEDDPVPAYLVFTVNTRMLERYERKVFDEPDDKWKQFVYNNRKPVKRKPVIRKPVATDNVPVITIDFVIGPNWAECAEIVERKYPFRQYAALTPRAIEFLNLCPCKLCKWENGKWIEVDQRPG
ncbi:uncharacterized protein ACA1_231570 [Acanthamoeba castellanii str. Neff]|uniref:Uncharacterized protein n=1 Tax=Acanthamoeba castellanii (strain ATCC 30010 / Neff) TaxID=1257118 RepID=L8H944_ACACF|nr:uncharacterized protein ACA1_231570 [Acanthamoeba castellanii str. Neff]ELR21690.1 hypothetical protein ACA1_231570 [Acanthamoeba castellanii str. Neff]